MKEEMVTTIHEDLLNLSKSSLTGHTRYVATHEQTLQDEHLMIAQMNELGFTRYAESRQHSEAFRQLGYSQSVVEQFHAYRLKYPLYEPVTDEVIQGICEKYDLVVGPINRYLGPIPDWAQQRVIAFRKKLETHPEDIALVSNFCTMDPRRESIPTHVLNSRSKLSKVLKRKYHHTSSGKAYLAPMQIVAPVQMFDTMNMLHLEHRLVYGRDSEMKSYIRTKNYDSIYDIRRLVERNKWLCEEGQTVTEKANALFDTRKRVASMSFDEAMLFLQENEACIPEGMQPEEFIVYANKMRNSYLRSLPFQELVDMFEQYTFLVKNGTTPLITAFKYASFSSIRDHFGSQQELQHYLEEHPEGIPKGYTAASFAFLVWEPIILQIMPVGNICLAAFGDEADLFENVNN